MTTKIALFMALVISLFSCKRNPSSVAVGARPIKEYMIRDYQYVPFKYFFVDSFYRNHYEKGFSENLETFYLPQEKDIQHLDVFISTVYNDVNAVRGIASTTPSKYDSIDITSYNQIKPIKGQLEKGYFAPLIEGVDYFFDHFSHDAGFFYLKKPINNSRSVAVVYQNREEKVGNLHADYSGNLNDRIINLRLIKCKNMTPQNGALWKLMLKNVYEINDTTLSYPNVNILIAYNDNGKYFFNQPEEPYKRFTFLLGLDIKDNQTGLLRDNGDGQYDHNVLTSYLAKGILIFPSLRPFDPLPQSRFQLNPANRSQIYNILPSDSLRLRESSKFTIMVEKYK